MTGTSFIIVLLGALCLHQSHGGIVRNSSQTTTVSGVSAETGETNETSEPTEPQPEADEEAIYESAENFKEAKGRGFEMGGQQQGVQQQRSGKSGKNQQQGLQQQLVAVIGGKPYVLQQQLAQQQQLLKDKKGKVSGVQQNQAQQQQAVADNMRSHSDSNSGSDPVE